MHLAQGNVVFNKIDTGVYSTLPSRFFIPSVDTRTQTSIPSLLYFSKTYHLSQPLW